MHFNYLEIKKITEQIRNKLFSLESWVCLCRTVCWEHMYTNTQGGLWRWQSQTLTGHPDLPITSSWPRSWACVFLCSSVIALHISKPGPHEIQCKYRPHRFRRFHALNIDPLSHVSRHHFVTHYLTGQFKPARNTKHWPNPPRFLLVHTKADLRHGDVDYLVYRVLTNDMKPVWFPLSSLWTVNINSVSPAFLSSFSQGLKMKTACAFLWKTPQFYCKNSPFTFPVFPYFLKFKAESSVNFISPSLSLSKHIYLQGGDVLAAGMGMKGKQLKSVR